MQDYLLSLWVSIVTVVHDDIDVSIYEGMEYFNKHIIVNCSP